MNEEDFVTTREKNILRIKSALIFTTTILIIGLFSWFLHSISDLHVSMSKLLKERNELQVKLEVQNLITQRDNALAGQLLQMENKLIKLDQCEKERFVDMKMIIRSYSLCGEGCREDDVLEALRKDKRTLLNEKKIVQLAE